MNPAASQKLNVACIVLLVVGLIGPAFGAEPTSQETVVRREARSFLPKPAGLEAKFRTGPPRIEIAKTLARRLGGSEIEELVFTPIQNLLHNSDRFLLSENSGPYYVKVTLSDLKISQTEERKGAKVGAFVKKAFAKSININGEGLDADWSNDELEMSVNCAVTVQLWDSVEGVLLEGAKGEVARTDTTKEIRAELAGLSYSKAAVAAAPGSDLGPVDFQSRIFELAAFEALQNMLANVDKRLAAGEGAKKAQTAPESAPQPQPNPAPETAGVFCENCGNKSNPGAKFCSKCGTRLPG